MFHSLLVSVSNHKSKKICRFVFLILQCQNVFSYKINNLRFYDFYNCMEITYFIFPKLYHNFSKFSFYWLLYVFSILCALKSHCRIKKNKKEIKKNIFFLKGRMIFPYFRLFGLVRGVFFKHFTAALASFL